MWKQIGDMVDYIEETIQELFDSVEADGRYDEELRAEAFEAVGAFSVNPTVGYDMTDEEHKKYARLLELRSECWKIQHEVDEIFEEVVTK